MKLYEFDPITGKYLDNHDAQLDEWQTEISGKKCYMAEANCTAEQPEEHEGFTPYRIQGVWQYIENTPLETVKQAKLFKLKQTRDLQEQEPVTTNKGTFDVDDKSLQRINGAITVLSLSNSTLEWTLADNTIIDVTAQDLTNVIIALAVQSNNAHEKYRELKERVEACSTEEEVEAVTWDLMSI